MTAKLPPLPFNKWDFDITLDFENAVASHQAYALQAVRQALERLVEKVEDRRQSIVDSPVRTALSFVIQDGRAIIKEYE